jgi:imidazolonepropionase-like amidohydrolase
MTRIWSGTGAAVALAVMAGGGCAPAQTAGVGGEAGAGVVAFTDVNVIPMDGERVLRGQTVVVRGGTIAAVGPSGSVSVPAGAVRVDGTGRYLMPGLAEMHAHVPGAQASAEWMEQLLFLYLANGVTTIRGMLGAPNQLVLRERIERGELLGPTFIVGAPSLNGNSAPDPETGRRLVREHVAAGYDFLKIHPGLERAVYDAIAETAREVGLTWAGHVPAAVGVEHAIASGQSTIDHLDGYLEGAGPAGATALGALVRGTDPDRLRALAEATRAAGVWNVPTQHLWETFASTEAPEALLERTEHRYVPPQMGQGWLQQKRNMNQQMVVAGSTAEDRALWVQRRREILRALADAGAPLLMGSDAPQLFNVPGFSIHPEVRAMAAAGLTPYRILESGTRNVARYAADELGLPGDFGTVAAGQRADLLLLEANPLDDVANLSRRAGVMVRGTWLPEEEIRRRLDAIAASHGG